MMRVKFNNKSQKSFITVLNIPRRSFEEKTYLWHKETVRFQIKEW